jgi:hypothetical protein
VPWPVHWAFTASKQRRVVPTSPTRHSAQRMVPVRYVGLKYENSCSGVYCHVMVLRTYSCRWGAMANSGECEFASTVGASHQLGPDMTGGGSPKTRATAVSCYYTTGGKVSGHNFFGTCFPELTIRTARSLLRATSTRTSCIRWLVRLRQALWPESGLNQVLS